MFSLLGVPVDAAYYLVSGFTVILTPVLGGMAGVAAIIAFTMAVRILLMPLSLRALRGQAAAARLAPQLQALRQRYARQPERLQREMVALYKREGTSIFAGITPLLLQWPFLSVMYLLFRSAQVGGKPNTLLGPCGFTQLMGPKVARTRSRTKARCMWAQPNGSRLSCGALKNDSFHNRPAPSASSAC